MGLKRVPTIQAVIAIAIYLDCVNTAGLGVKAPSNVNPHDIIVVNAVCGSLWVIDLNDNTWLDYLKPVYDSSLHIMYISGVHTHTADL